MGVELESKGNRCAVLRLVGIYTLFEIEQALQGAQLSGETLVIDMRCAEVDHSAFELERLAAISGSKSRDLLLRTADQLRFGFARTLMGYCSAKGVTVRIDHVST